jgi:uncharacterized protein (DUF608 family)
MSADALVPESTGYADRVFTGGQLDRVAFPLGGIGAGMICLEGSGALSHVSIHHAPDVARDANAFGALWVKGAGARVIEGPVPRWKLYGPRLAAVGGPGSLLGLPRFAEASFRARFPFGMVELRDPAMPVEVRLTGWSPFVPLDADASSLPVVALEYELTNVSAAAVDAVWSFHAAALAPNPAGGVSGTQRVGELRGGFTLEREGSADRPWEAEAISFAADASDARVNCRWFRGGWFDAQTVLWSGIAAGEAPQAGPYEEGDPSPGGSIFVRLRLAAGERRTIRIQLAWYVPVSNLRYGEDDGAATHVPWYAGQFGGIDEVTAHWRERYDELRAQSAAFSSCLHDTTLPSEVIEAIGANLGILKSPTVLRQRDGRIWAWEGCGDRAGCCAGSCTHVWNYAQAMGHLFPALERTLRETEFKECQDERGHQAFRAFLPIRPASASAHEFHAAADGQLGGVMKAHREWRIAGDAAWLRRLWPQIRRSLDYCIDTWDPDRLGVVREPHHNTYDIEFWGADGMCTSIYLGALRAAMSMGEAIGEDVATYGELLSRGRERMEHDLFQGEYFVQRIEWRQLRADDPASVAGLRTNYSPEATKLLEAEGPKYQYGRGCLSDGVIGAWLGEMCGVPAFLDAAKVERHLLSVFKHNFRSNLREHTNPQRATYALGDDAGLLLCSWPEGGDLSLPFVYSNEVWTGIEYQVASHLMLCGHVDEALRIVRAVRARYDGTTRNPYDEYECGHWYARALASYGMLQALTGVRYDAVEGVLHVRPRLPGDLRAFISTATGWGTIRIERGEVSVDALFGTIDIGRIAYTPFGSEEEVR